MIFTTMGWAATKCGREIDVVHHPSTGQSFHSYSEISQYILDGTNLCICGPQMIYPNDFDDPVTFMSQFLDGLLNGLPQNLACLFIFIHFILLVIHAYCCCTVTQIIGPVGHFIWRHHCCVVAKNKCSQSYVA